MAAALLSVVSLGLSTTTVATIDCLRAIGRRVLVGRGRRSRKQRQRAALIARFDALHKQATAAAAAGHDDDNDDQQPQAQQQPQPIARRAIVENPGDPCAICLEALGAGPASHLRCSHVFHTGCMLEHVSRSQSFLCPRGRSARRCRRCWRRRRHRRESERGAPTKGGRGTSIRMESPGI